MVSDYHTSPSHHGSSVVRGVESEGEVNNFFSEKGLAGQKQAYEALEAQAKRAPVKYRYDALWPDFLRLMADIGGIADQKYAHLGGVFNYTKTRLEGEASPINHIYEHLREYRLKVPYDNHEDGDIGRHLAAIAYNAMMEWWYLTNIDGKETVNDAKGRP